MSDIPVGERPPQGGRIKEYGSASERAAAWRARRRDTSEGPGAVPTTDTPELAPAFLALLLEDLKAETAARRQHDQAHADRLEAAIAAIADPDAVGAALEAARTEATQLIADAEAQVARAEQRRAVAEADARRSTDLAEQAREAADALDDHAQELEQRIVDLQARLDAEIAGRAADHDRHVDQVHHLEADHQAALTDLRRDLEEAHTAELERLTADHTASLAQLAAAHDAQVGALTTTHRAEIDELTHRLNDAADARARAEGTTVALTADLEHARTETATLRDELAAAQQALPRAVEDARTDTTATLGRQHHAEVDALHALHSAQLEAANARQEAEVTRLRAELQAADTRRQAAEEIASTYRQLASQTDSPTKPTPRGRRSKPSTAPEA